MSNRPKLATEILRTGNQDIGKSYCNRRHHSVRVLAPAASKNRIPGTRFHEHGRDSWTILPGDPRLLRFIAAIAVVSGAYIRKDALPEIGQCPINYSGEARWLECQETAVDPPGFERHAVRQPDLEERPSTGLESLHWSFEDFEFSSPTHNPDCIGRSVKNSYDLLRPKKKDLCLDVLAEVGGNGGPNRPEYVVGVIHAAQSNYVSQPKIKQREKNAAYVKQKMDLGADRLTVEFPNYARRKGGRERPPAPQHNQSHFSEDRLHATMSIAIRAVRQDSSPCRTKNGTPTVLSCEVVTNRLGVLNNMRFAWDWSCDRRISYLLLFRSKSSIGIGEEAVKQTSGAWISALAGGRSSTFGFQQ
ncbi:hypothetical protein B0H11DRAFT_1906580 [Mycena galericulata]|nr:hypothetical protein B0H11DRAFT_1906580 [Mycena galericulata]